MYNKNTISMDSVPTLRSDVTRQSTPLGVLSLVYLILYVEVFDYPTQRHYHHTNLAIKWMVGTDSNTILSLSSVRQFVSLTPKIYQIQCKF
jgi:hypothetical protein